MASSSLNVLMSSSDTTIFAVEEEVALQFPPVKQMLAERTIVGHPLPLQNITGRVLSQMLKYLRKHMSEAADERALEEFDSSFTDELEKDQRLLFDVLVAAHNMQMKGLKDLLCKKIAGMMEGKPAEEIRKIFHIKNDYTPEEEEAIRLENSWAFP